MGIKIKQDELKMPIEIVKAEDKQSPEYVYFIDDGIFIKIGKSINPIHRMEQLQSANARELKLLGTLIEFSEAKVHQIFNHLRVRGEWFKREAELIAFIENNKSLDFELQQKTREELINIITELKR